MPNIVVPNEKPRWVKATPVELFASFYAALGFVITGCLFAAAFISIKAHPSYLPLLFGWAAASPLIWGVCYGAWVKRLTWSWHCLVTMTVIGLLAGAFAVMSDPDLLAGLFGASGGVFLLWALGTGVKLCNWPDQ